MSMDHKGIVVWLKRDWEPADLYELLGRSRFDPACAELREAILAAYAELMPYQNHADAAVARRAMKLQVELGRAEGTLADSTKLRAHHQAMISRIQSAYREASGRGDSVGTPEGLKAWLRETQAVHPKRCDDLALVLGSPVAGAAALERLLVAPPSDPSRTEALPQSRPVAERESAQGSPHDSSVRVFRPWPATTQPQERGPGAAVRHGSEPPSRKPTLPETKPRVAPPALPQTAPTGAKEQPSPEHEPTWLTEGSQWVMRDWLRDWMRWVALGLALCALIAVLAVVWIGQRRTQPDLSGEPAAISDPIPDPIPGAVTDPIPATIFDIFDDSVAVPSGPDIEDEESPLTMARRWRKVQRSPQSHSGQRLQLVGCYEGVSWRDGRGTVRIERLLGRPGECLECQFECPSGVHRLVEFRKGESVDFDVEVIGGTPHNPQLALRWVASMREPERRIDFPVRSEPGDTRPLPRDVPHPPEPTHDGRVIVVEELPETRLPPVRDSRTEVPVREEASSQPRGHVRPRLAMEGRRLLTIDAHQRTAAVAWSSDGSYLATCGSDGPAEASTKVWDARTAALLHTFREPAASRLPSPSVYDVVWMSPRPLVAAGCRGALRVWNLRSDSEAAALGHRVDQERIVALAWNERTEFLAAGASDGAVYLIRRTTTSRRETQVKQTHSGPVQSIAWRPDGEAYASGHRGAVWVWSPDDEWPRRGMGAGPRLLNAVVKILEQSESEQVPDIVATDNQTDTDCNMLAWSPDGNRLAIAGSRLEVWDLSVADENRLLYGKVSTSKPSRFAAVQFSPDGRLLAAADNNTVFVLHASTGLPVFQWRCENVVDLSFDPSGKHLATASGSGQPVYVWAVR